MIIRCDTDVASDLAYVSITVGTIMLHIVLLSVLYIVLLTWSSVTG